jgi:UDP-N-acetylglucosamine:LPS N-acetylglucosamine transferase
LGAEQQENIMNRAKFIIARPGYTTVMELAELNKNRVLFLPTPGQTEQEYLADYYEKRKYFHHVSQYRLKLKKAIQDSAEFTGFTPAWKTEQSLKEFTKAITS